MTQSGGWSYNKEYNKRSADTSITYESKTMKGISKFMKQAWNQLFRRLSSRVVI